MKNFLVFCCMIVFFATSCSTKATNQEADVVYHILRSRTCTLEELKSHKYKPRLIYDKWGDTSKFKLIWRNRFISSGNRDTTAYHLKKRLLGIGLNPENIDISNIFAPSDFVASTMSVSGPLAKVYSLCDDNAHVILYPPQDSTRKGVEYFLTISKGIMLNDSLSLYYYELSERRQGSSGGYTVLKRSPDGTLSAIYGDMMWTY